MHTCSFWKGLYMPSAPSGGFMLGQHKGVRPFYHGCVLHWLPLPCNKGMWTCAKQRCHPIPDTHTHTPASLEYSTVVSRLISFSVVFMLSTQTVWFKTHRNLLLFLEIFFSQSLRGLLFVCNAVWMNEWMNGLLVMYEREQTSPPLSAHRLLYSLSPSLFLSLLPMNIAFMPLCQPLL